jgi:hypothetical protein
LVALFARRELRRSLVRAEHTRCGVMVPADRRAVRATRAAAVARPRRAHALPRAWWFSAHALPVRGGSLGEDLGPPGAAGSALSAAREERARAVTARHSLEPGAGGALARRGAQATSEGREREPTRRAKRRRASELGHAHKRLVSDVPAGHCSHRA